MIKQIPIIVTVAVLWINTSVAATTSGVPETVSQSFNADYGKVESVSWVSGPGYYKANFSLDGQYYFAFYDESGEKLGEAHYLLSSQLPTSLKKDIWDRFDSYWLTDLFEYVEEADSHYYVTLENASEKLVLKSNGNGWEVYRRTALES